MWNSRLTPVLFAATRTKPGRRHGQGTETAVDGRIPGAVHGQLGLRHIHRAVEEGLAAAGCTVSLSPTAWIVPAT